MIDTHVHLDFKDFNEDREEVISRAFDNGVKAIVNIGVDLKTSEKSVELAENHENIFAAVGFHPDYFSKLETHNAKRDWIDKLKELARNKKVVAIGETGLDYFHIKKPDFSRGNPVSVAEIKENQKKGFLAQIEMAKELGLPVVVHCREAWNDLFEMIQSEKSIRFVLHCYSGEKKDTEKFLELPNVCFSFSGNITYPKPASRAEKLAEAVQMIPLERTMLDSDSPFLAPQQARGKRNEPSYVRYIAEKIAEIKEISIEKVEKTTDENANEFFGLD